MEAALTQRVDALNNDLNTAVNDVDAALEADEARQLTVGVRVDALVAEYRSILGAAASPAEKGQLEKRFDRRVMDLRRAAARLAQRPTGRTAERAHDAGGQPFLMQRAPGRQFSHARAVPTQQFSVGGEVEAWCGKCKEMREHRIVAMVSGEPKQIICATCSSKHSYRAGPPTKGRGAVKAVEAEAGTALTPRPGDREADQRREEKRKLQEELAAVENPRPFDPAARYKSGEIIVHPELGRGKIESVLRGSMLVRFAEGLRPVNLR